MTPAEAAALLGIAASVDNRKPDPDIAKSWSVLLDGLRFEDCRDAIVAHYRQSSEWLTPQAVIAEVKRIRAKRIAAHPDPIPPADLSPAETNRWLRETRRAIADGQTFDTPALDGPRRDVVAELGHVGRAVPREHLARARAAIKPRDTASEETA